MHTFLRADGKVIHSDTFMRGPRAGEGKVWIRRYDNVWVEEDTPHGPESDPNHKRYELHLFGEHHESFLRRQYMTPNAKVSGAPDET